MASSSDFNRLVRAAPAPVVPLQEVGLKALRPITEALAKQPVGKSVPVLEAVSGLLAHVPALRLFTDLSPARAPPEQPLVLNSSQVEADSTRSGASYGVSEAFLATEPKAKISTYWCSKARPSNGKSAVTITFRRPEQLTGIFLANAEEKVSADLIGLQAMAAGEGVDTPHEITSFVSGGRGKWQTLGVVPTKLLGTAGTRLPLTAHNIVALRISFKVRPQPTPSRHCVHSHHPSCSLTRAGRGG